MKKKKCFIMFLLILTLFTFTACGNRKTADLQKQTKNEKNVITDLGGRKVTLPSKINRIAVIQGDPEYLVWRLAPNKLVNKDTYFSEANDRVFPQKFMRTEDIKKFQLLPSTGMYSNVITEQIIMLKPDIVLTLNRDPGINSEAERFGVPVIGTSKDSLSDFEKSIRLIGKIVGNEKGGNDLANYWSNSVKKVTNITSKIPQNKKLKVYYASSDPTNTIGTKTTQASIIRSAGGINYYDANPIIKNLEESEAITTSVEQIILWNPDVIITGSSKAKSEILTNPQWKNIKAIINNHVYSTLEYACMDHYESLLNLMWTSNKLYPNKVKIDLNKEAKDFYKKFYYTDNITNADMAIERK